MAKLDEHLPNVVSFPKPLRPGDRVLDAELLVLEVRMLRSTLTLAGRQRQLFVAVHEKDKNGSMLTLFVKDSDDAQKEWST